MKVLTKLLVVSAMTLLSAGADEPGALPASMPPTVVEQSGQSGKDAPARVPQAATAQQSQYAEAIGYPVDLLTKHTQIALRIIPPGEFQMGNPTPDKNKADDARLHRVRLTKGFYCGIYEITQRQWQRVMGGSDYSQGGRLRHNDDLPMEFVSWEDCQQFLHLLNEQEAVPPGTYRLLTEAEWEYACRAGTNTPYAFGEKLTPEAVNCDLPSWALIGFSDGPGYFASKLNTRVVGSMPANAWGLHEMHGNVWEWCSDIFVWEFAAGPVTDPHTTRPDYRLIRVVRGGGWSSPPSSCRSFSRAWYPQNKRYATVGLRIARAIP